MAVGSDIMTLSCVGGVEIRLHVFWVSCRWRNQSQSHITTDGQSSTQSWFQATAAAQDQIFVTVSQLGVLSMWDAFSDEKASLSFMAVIVNSTCHLYLQLYLSAFYIIIWRNHRYIFAFTISKDTDSIENVASNSYFVIALYSSAGMCLPRRWLATIGRTQRLTDSKEIS
jgi:hypothetical protein